MTLFNAYVECTCPASTNPMMSFLLSFPSFSSSIILSIPLSALASYRHMGTHICRCTNSFWLPITTGDWSMSTDVPIPRLPWWLTSVCLQHALSGASSTICTVTVYKPKVIVSKGRRNLTFSLCCTFNLCVFDKLTYLSSSNMDLSVRAHCTSWSDILIIFTSTSLHCWYARVPLHLFWNREMRLNLKSLVQDGLTACPNRHSLMEV